MCQIRKLVPLDKSEDLYTDPNSLICYIGCIFTVLLQDKVLFRLSIVKSRIVNGGIKSKGVERL